PGLRAPPGSVGLGDDGDLRPHFQRFVFFGSVQVYDDQSNLRAREEHRRQWSNTCARREALNSTRICGFTVRDWSGRFPNLAMLNGLGHSGQIIELDVDDRI